MDIIPQLGFALGVLTFFAKELRSFLQMFLDVPRCSWTCRVPRAAPLDPGFPGICRYPLAGPPGLRFPGLNFCNCFALLCVALHVCIALHCFALLCIALHCFALYCFALHCFALLCIALHCIALRCFALLCIALHCFAVHFEGARGTQAWRQS